MLRLWPDELQIGLFGEHCWLYDRRTNALREHRVALAPGGAGGAMAPSWEALVAMLDDPANGVRPGARVALTVSDSLAAIIALPWQEALRQPEERQCYARLLFDKDGLDVAPDDVMQADFARYGGCGLAYAFPRTWMEALLLILKERTLRLQRVLPASAAAYYLTQRGNGDRLFLLQEPRRTSALLFSAGRFLGMDVEPVMRAGDEAMLRLLRRVLATYGKPTSIVRWSSQLESTVAHAALLAAELPDLNPVLLTREALR